MKDLLKFVAVVLVAVGFINWWLCNDVVCALCNLGAVVLGGWGALK